MEEGLKKEMKYIEFGAIFHLLKNGTPMIDFESLKESFEFLKFVNAPKKHWIDSSEWGMARAMHNVVLKQMKMVLQQNKFISISCDEITTLDNQSWILMHAYVVEKWRRQPILLNLERVVEGSTSNSFITMIICSLIDLGGLLVVDVVYKVVCFGADGVQIFKV